MIAMHRRAIHPTSHTEFSTPRRINRFTYLFVKETHSNGYVSVGLAVFFRLYMILFSTPRILTTVNKQANSLLVFSDKCVSFSEENDLPSSPSSQF